MKLAGLVAAYLEPRPIEHQGVDRGAPIRTELQATVASTAGRVSAARVVVEDGHVAEKELWPQSLPIRVDARW